MFKLALLVVLLLVLVALLVMGAGFYLALRHPRLATPLIVAGTLGAVLVGAVAIVGSQ
ncbi:hypothetical protein [Streptomyces sp. NPDC000229]|uniref:hypothetical protein n=1 Tax=Streptomyces sp. NPDC000229 TaxID=3154247 RepID=UPI0033319D4E